MKQMKKALYASIVAVLIFSLVMVAQASEPIPKPSVPEFTVMFLDSSYDVNVTYSIDSYTGAILTNNASVACIENKTIIVIIKNQPFIPYLNENGSLVTLTYNIRVKNDQDLMMKEYGFSATVPLYHVETAPAQSYSDFTPITFSVQNANWYSGISSSSFFAPAGAKLDFQVKAMIGYVTRVWETPLEPYVFTGEESGWSEIQSITLPNSSQTHTPAPNSSGSTSTPTTSSSSPVADKDQNSADLLPYAFIVIAGVAIAFVAGALFSRLHYKRLSPKKDMDLSNRRNMYT
jgi:hypothetical protein